MSQGNEFQPFGEEWFKEMKKLRKDDLIRMYALLSKEKIAMEAENKWYKHILREDGSDNSDLNLAEAQN